MILELLRSNDRSNILLAIELAKGRGMDLSDYWHKVQELYNSMDSRRLHSPAASTASSTLEDCIYFLTCPNINWSFRYAAGGDTLSFSRDLELLAELRQVQNLNLYAARTGSLPHSIGLLSDLRNLEALHNDIEELPESIGNLSQLTCLLLDHNRLSDLPDSFSNLHNIKHLSLASNNFYDLPPSLLPLLPRLEYLDMSGNPKLSAKAKMQLERFGF